MEEAEPSRYVTQLRAEFDGCDSTATGFLDREELTELSRKLQLDAHLPLLLDTLLGERPHGRVNFEEFKNGLVVVLSHSLDFSTSEDDSSYLEPAIPQEVKPKFVKGAKRYGRRSRPETQSSTSLDSTPTRTKPVDLNLDSSPPGVRRAKLRRSTSLESVESLKSDEETGSSRMDQQLFHNKADQQQDAGGRAGGCDVAAVCDHLDLQDALLQRLDANRDANLDANQDGRVTIRKVLWSSAPTLSSTPIRSADLQTAPLWNQQLVPDGPARSLLTATVGPRVLTRLDDGSGGTSPERVAALWAEAGIRNSQQILQSLDFPLEERLSLSDLTLVLDNELLLSANSVHQAALISYRTEIQHLQEALEQASRERDKLRSDVDRADQQNLQLVREADDRHASIEALNQNRIRDLESDFRRRAAALRLQAEQENEALLQQGERERSALRQELQLLRGKEAELQEELDAAAQETQRLQQELGASQSALREADGSVQRLQTDLDQLLLHKLGGLDPAGAGLSHEERICELLRESQRQCRELQDRNDELSSALLEAQRSSRRSSRPSGGAGGQRDAAGDPDMRSIQSELALQQLKESHQEALQQLHIQLETQVNYYERQLDMMKQNMEVERKDICQAFKVEISELEEQKVQVEQQLKEALTRLQNQQGAGLTAEEQRRVQRERAELEQNYAREISNLVQKLSAEKEQLEAELKLHAQQEVMRVRAQLEAVRSENAALQERLKVLQQTVQNLEDESEKRRRRQQEVEEEQESSREEEERLHRENSRYREEVLDLSGRNLQLSTDNGNLSNRLHSEQETVRTLRERLATVTKEQEEEEAAVSRLEAELSDVKAELSRVRAELQKVEEEKEELQKDGEQQKRYVEEHQAEARRLIEEKAELQQNLQTHRLTIQYQEQKQQNLNQEQQNLKSRLDQVETARTQAEEQAQRADAALGVAKAQQLRRLQQLQEHAGGRQRLEQLQAELRAERGRSQQRRAQLELQLQQSRSQASLKQEQFDRTVAALQQRAAGLEAQLKALRGVLQDNVQQLKEQMERSNKMSSALKELHLQNAQLLAALQVTELRQKRAEKKNDQLEDKVTALGALLREVVAAAVTSS